MPHPCLEPEGTSTPDRLRWIADYLDVADKALSIISCVRGLDYPEDLHRGAQQDLRRWARWLDARPVLADGLAVARLVPGSEDLVGENAADGAVATASGW
ncbi:MAG TPA: hypothetical protein VG412_03505 [Acidimicrobiales bacterium]|nr:hypothetical protein [Acidimicrobiales bacterium]